jgi:hypothetical protein
VRRWMFAAPVALLAVLATTVFGVRGAPSEATAQKRPGLTPMQQRLLSGTASVAVQSTTTRRALGAAAALAQDQTPTRETGCPANRGTNVRANQECQNLTDPDLAGRGQAQNETSIAQDPNHPWRMIASSNDYRRGDGNCYAYVSRNGGGSWRDSTIPMSFTRGTAFGAARQYWGGGGDTSVAFDTKGNAYLSCQVFNRGTPTSSNPDLSSAFYVYRTPGAAIDRGGANWTFPGRPVAEVADVAGTGETDFLDKQLLTVDNHRGSPYQDRVYVTWTTFAADGTAYIYEAYSSDYGEHFSAPVLVSGASPLCTNTFDVPTPQGPCNSNQFSQPFTGPDGALYVVWANYNTATSQVPGEDEGEGGDDGITGQQAEGGDNRNQLLLARSADGGQTFSAPVKVADFYELPDCQTYQGADEGRACVPEKGETANSIFRAANYPVGAVNPRNPRRVTVTFGSYINRHSNEDNGCVPEGYNEDTALPLYAGVKTTGACNNDIVVSTSRNAGQTFSGQSTDPRDLPSVRQGDGATDQWFQWADYAPSGRFAVSYYDRYYGDDEQTGFSDFSVSGSSDALTFTTARATSSSMPPPTQFQGTFWGDYTGLTVVKAGAHPSWSDTRDPELFTCRDAEGNVALPPTTCTAPGANADPANDQNVYVRSMGLP